MASTDQQKLQVFADCYILTGSRASGEISSFLNEFIPDRTPYEEKYELPQLAPHPSKLLNGDNQLLAYLERHPKEPYAVYWYNNREEKIRGAMCLYTDDGHLIAGLFCESRFPDNSIEIALLAELKTFWKSEKGIILYQEPAPRTTKKFMDIWKNAY
jgi:hypothetical protein